MKVYLVSEGRWSDYYIAAVYSTRELAEAYVERRRPVVEAQWDRDFSLGRVVAGYKERHVAENLPHIEEFELDGGPNV